jgi:hypothetical protein
MLNTEIKARSESLLEYVDDNWERALDPDNFLLSSDVFKDRLDKVYKTLSEWKPSSTRELWYTSYGGVDLVGIYAFWTAAILGVIAVFGLAIADAQTYASLKTLYLTNST